MSALQAQPFLIVLSMWSVSLLAGSVSPGISGFWFGAIETPGSPLGVRVELRQGADGWSGTIDIPQQGAKGLLLEAVEVDGNEVGFRIQGVGGAPTFNGKLVEGRIRGTFRQGAAEFPFALERGMVPEAAEPPRPQEPAPPYPYLEREVTYRRGEIEFAGTLTLPQGSEPHPAVLLLTGSGAQDRDETVFGHRPFLVLADYLTRAGIAVLRVDDRGIGGSSGSLEGVTTQDLAEDALAGVRFLQELPAIAAGHVGLLGHSEGALVATLAAAKSGDVAFIVLVAGPGVPGREILAQQNRLILEAAGVPAEVVDWQAAVLDELVGLLLAGEKLDTLERRVAELRTEREKTQGEVLGELESRLLEGVGEQLPRLSSRWFIDFLTLDPRSALRQVKVPVLAVAGELDLQVPPDPNQFEIEKALQAAENKDVTVSTLVGLNHLLQEAETGHPSEYARIEETISPAALEIVAEWIANRTRISSEEEETER